MLRLLPLLYLLSTALFSTVGSVEKPAEGHWPAPAPIAVAGQLAASPFYLTEESALLGEQACVQVLAQGFDAIRGFQYSIAFDTSRLSFSGLEINAAAGLGLEEDNFNLDLAAAGTIIVLYLPPDGQARSLADGTELYQLCFQTVAAGLAEVRFSQTPTPILVVNDDLEELPLSAANDGSVEVLLCRDTTIAIDTSICAGQSILVGGTIFTAAGQYQVNLTTAVGGCDSIILLNLGTAEVGFAFPDSVLVCPGSQATLQAPDSIRVGLVGGLLGQSIVLNPGASYNLTVENVNNGCSSAQTVFIGTLPQPVVVVEGPNQFCSGDIVTLTASGAVSYVWSTGETTASITVSAAGNYAVTGTNANGCLRTVVRALQELPLPAVAIDGPSQLCPGESVTLTASGAASYVWSTGETTASISVSAAGTYAVTGTDADGCANTASHDVTALSSPDVAIAGPAGFCAGESAVLAASGAASYVWSTGATTPSITVSAPGNYAVTGTDANGCTAQASIAVAEFPLPTISFIGTTQVCAGQTAAITAVGGQSYAWSNGFTTATVMLGTGTFTVTATDAQGCQAEASITITGDAEAPVFIFCPGNRSGVLNYQETSVSVSWIEPLATDNCGSAGLTLTSTHQPGDAFPLGTTTVVYTATDGAGNSAECRFDVVVENSADLTFYVDSTAVTYLGDTACVPIKVLDFNNVNGFQYTIVAPEPALGRIVGIEPLGLLTGVNMGDIDFFAIDPDTYGIIWASNSIAGNTLPDSTAILNVKMVLDLGPDECAPLAIVGSPLVIEAAQNGLGIVPTVIGRRVCLIREVDIFGQVRKVNGEPIGRAELLLTGDALEADTTSPQGFYAFPGLPGGGSYRLTPTRDFDDAEGVTVLDLIRIFRHISFVELLDDDPFAPYLLIAADANNDQLITVADLVELQDLILGRISQFNSNTSWRFVPVSYVFPQPSNPWAEVFPEAADFFNLTVDALADFYGIKIGDVNLTAMGQLQPSGTSFLLVAEQHFAAGELIEVPLQARWDGSWAGLQAELEFDRDALEFVAAEAGSLAGFDPKACIGAQAAREGRLPIAWVSLETGGAKAEGTLFSLRFRAKRAGRLSEALRLAPRGLPPLAVGSAMEVQRLGLAIGALPPADGPAVRRPIGGLWALPNPFGAQTELQFVLNEDELVSIRLYDAQGQLLRQERRRLGAGPQAFALDGTWMPHAGLYLCQIQAGEQTEVLRLIKQ
jgi:hypothetical protein